MYGCMSMHGCMYMYVCMGVWYVCMDVWYAMGVCDACMLCMYHTLYDSHHM